MLSHLTRARICCRGPCPPRACGRATPRSGQILVILALSFLILVCFVSLVIELGRVTAAKQTADRAAMEAALAAGMRLPNQTTGLTAATALAQLNGASSVQVTYPAGDRVSVTCVLGVRYLMGKLWGVEQAGAQANAQVSLTDCVSTVSTGLRPLAVAPSAYTLSGSVSLAVMSLPGTFDGTKFLPLALGGTSAAQYVRNLEQGYSGAVAVGDTVSCVTSQVRNANKTGIISDASTGNALFQQAARAPYSDNGSTYSHPDYPYGDPRVALVAVCQTSGPAATTATVVGFAALYLRTLSSNGVTLTGRFLEYATRAGVPGDGTLPDYGLHGYGFVQ